MSKFEVGKYYEVSDEYGFAGNNSTIKKGDIVKVVRLTNVQNNCEMFIGVETDDDTEALMYERYLSENPYKLQMGDLVDTLEMDMGYNLCCKGVVAGILQNGNVKVFITETDSETHEVGAIDTFRKNEVMSQLVQEEVDKELKEQAKDEFVELVTAALFTDLKIHKQDHFNLDVSINGKRISLTVEEEYPMFFPEDSDTRFIKGAETSRGKVKGVMLHSY